jgi:hypothetical protein
VIYEEEVSIDGILKRSCQSHLPWSTSLQNRSFLWIEGTGTGELAVDCDSLIDPSGDTRVFGGGGGCGGGMEQRDEDVVSDGVAAAV